MKLVNLVTDLDNRRVPYRLNRVRDAVMVEIATPGKHWEVEFMDDGSVEVEVFQSDGTISNEAAIAELMRDLE